MHAKVRTGGERVQMWIGLGQGEFRVNRAGWDVTVVTLVWHWN